MAIIGIDLGTTNSLAVAYLEDHYVMIPNCYGEYLTPSVVSVDDDGSILVGKIAKERLVSEPQCSTSLFKRDMGTTKVTTLNEINYHPEELSALVVKQLIKDAEHFLKEKIEEVVISVPAYFNEHQRTATKRIGALLGVQVKRLINEPSAAALACHQGNEADESFIIFDFGGGTLDVSVVDCFDNVVSICSIAGDNQLGGSDFDMLIVEDFCEQNNILFDTLDSQHKGSLLLQCERAKIDLQTKPASDVVLNFKGQEYHYTITCERLQELGSSIFDKVKKVVGEAVNSSGFGKGEIETMILVGGSCHMPIMVDFLKSLMSIDVVEVQNMDHIVAQGLGTYIGIKQRKRAVKELVLTDICPFSLGIGVHNEVEPQRPLYSILIPRNTVLPASKSDTYYTINKGQTVIKFCIYQGEAMYAFDNDKLANYSIVVPKNLKEHEAVRVTFSYDINALLCVEFLVESTKEYHQFYVGKQEATMNVELIKHAALKLNNEPDVHYIEERVKRLLEESSPLRQEQIKEVYMQFIHLKHQYENNLHKLAKLIEKMKIQVDELAKQNGDCAYFDVFEENEDEKGWLS